MNHSDSERIAGFLELHKFRPAKNINEAELIIFNTCGVRQSAEDRVYGQIHNLKSKNKNLKLKIILTGCLANRKDVQKRLRDKIDLFFPISDFKKFENWIIKNYLEIKNLKLKIASQKRKTLRKTDIDYLSINSRRNNAYRALVPIMTGCDNFCSYCVVPSARGRETSRPAKEIIAKVKNLTKKGVKEIILLGQNVNSYHFWISNSKSRISGEDSKRKFYNFSKLLKEINKIPGNFRIHFVSNHPKDVTDELIETAAKLSKVCECFHLPLQAGNNDVLRRMNRKYSRKQYFLLIQKIKVAYKKHKADKLFSITSDIIVGFPGETRRQFMDSAEVMKKAKYDMVYFGQFSPRPGTAAWQMKDDVSKSEKAWREKYLNEILKKTASKNNRKYVGRIEDVLVEKQKNSLARLAKNEYFGKTRTMKNVKFASDKKKLIGKIVRVKIIKAGAWNLEGAISK